MTEQQIVQRLGNPDGVIGPAGSRALIYYYVPSDGEASFVAVDLRVNVLLHMGYNDASQLPRSALQPYRPPQRTTAPATPPGVDGATPTAAPASRSGKLPSPPRRDTTAQHKSATAAHGAP